MSTTLSAVSGFFLDLIETFVIGLSLFLVVYLFFMQPHQVSGMSMEPNLHSHDYVLTDKISYRLGTPQRGDVIVFHAPPAAHCPAGTGCDFIKRVMGLPGEMIEVKNNSIYVNGTALKEPYLPTGTETMANAFTNGRVVQLGQDEYFVAGDNRTNSSDSRSWGPITSKNIVGKAFFRYWPVPDVSVIAKPSYAL
ncbi:MAG: signal peptidase I [Candidatus Pacebacteria bacterium CG_4_10_14_0_8_um_filter_43_12]|nr:MAG: signal peptidase I [Candidatus Pacebacteria bacterium CG10_big_fil_rev_8_21_14_0_10_44_11]PIY78982.1 MAG: signal peptidase I [Candidatus Pacebacteria bacterium CG_4_10_14_0_8_um_filter_43_12]